VDDKFGIKDSLLRREDDADDEDDEEDDIEEALIAGDACVVDTIDGGKFCG